MFFFLFWRENIEISKEVKEEEKIVNNDNNKKKSVKDWSTQDGGTWPFLSRRFQDSSRFKSRPLGESSDWVSTSVCATAECEHRIGRRWWQQDFDLGVSHNKCFFFLFSPLFFHFSPEETKNLISFRRKNLCRLWLQKELDKLTCKKSKKQYTTLSAGLRTFWLTPWYRGESLGLRHRSERVWIPVLLLYSLLD